MIAPPALDRLRDRLAALTRAGVNTPDDVGDLDDMIDQLDGLAVAPRSPVSDLAHRVASGKLTSSTIDTVEAELREHARARAEAKDVAAGAAALVEQVARQADQLLTRHADDLIAAYRIRFDAAVQIVDEALAAGVRPAKLYAKEPTGHGVDPAMNAAEALAAGLQTATAYTKLHAEARPVLDGARALIAAALGKHERQIGLEWFLDADDITAAQKRGGANGSVYTDFDDAQTTFTAGQWAALRAPGARLHQKMANSGQIPDTSRPGFKIALNDRNRTRAVLTKHATLGGIA